MSRDVVLIVAVGIALGVAHNVIGHMSRPPRGIAWRATPAVLPDLESLTPKEHAAGTASESLATAGGATPGLQAPPDRGRLAENRAIPTRPAGDRAAASPSPRRGGHVPALLPASEQRPAEPPAKASTGESAPGPVISHAGGPLPFIPETDQPVQVKLALVKRFFDAGAALFVDARDPAEFESGHIPGAVRLASADAAADPDRVKSLPVRGRPIIVYCEGGACEASLEVARVLVEAGYRKVLVYTGGFPEWAAAGHPIERGSGRS